MQLEVFLDKSSLFPKVSMLTCVKDRTARSLKCLQKYALSSQNLLNCHWHVPTIFLQVMNNKVKYQKTYYY